MIKKYKKKPIVISAIQFNGWNHAAVRQFMSKETLWFPQSITYEETLEIKTLEGVMIANVDDYIIKGVQGEFYPCKPDIFEQTYEEEN